MMHGYISLYIKDITPLPSNVEQRLEVNIHLLPQVPFSGAFGDIVWIDFRE